MSFKACQGGRWYCWEQNKTGTWFCWEIYWHGKPVDVEKTGRGNDKDEAFLNLRKQEKTT